MSRMVNGKIKKIMATAISFVMLATMSGCGDKQVRDTSKVQIIATLFPQYDFARQIGGDKVEVTMLLSPGMESHSFDPTPSDIVSINKSDLFIYTGEYMETWADTIIDSIDEKNVSVLDVSKGIKLDKEGHEDEEHDHEHDTDEHYHEYEPHIWTSPINAMQMVDNILEALVEIDPENEVYYTDNANNYKDELTKLDEEFREVVAQANRTDIYFGGRFAMYYFAKEYGLNCIAAYDSCSSETEPSAGQVANIIDSMKEHNAKVVFHEELVNPQVATTIAEAVDGKTLLLHSCHNVSKEEFENGVTYIDLMKQNVINLEEGLK